MARLRNIIIADPSAKVAEMIVEQTERLAEHRHVATNGALLLLLAQEHEPEVVIVSLELHKPAAEEVVKMLQEADKQTGRRTFIVATFRELAVNEMEKLDCLGIEDFLPQPIDFVQLFRTVSLRFSTGFRRHARHAVSVEVVRHDGKTLGMTADLSEGGLSIKDAPGLRAGQSVFIELRLPAPTGSIRVRCAILDSDGDSGHGGKSAAARAKFENLRGEDRRRLLSFLAGHPEVPSPD